MESLAEAFDEPVDSPVHRRLAETVWLGGSHVSVRYWLGRLLGRNLFREPDELVAAVLQKYFRDRGNEKTALLVSNYGAWSAVSIVLQHHAYLAELCGPIKNGKLIAVLEAMIVDPDLTDSDLATIAKTTEKQIARMSDVSYLRRLWRLRSVQPH